MIIRQGQPELFFQPGRSEEHTSELQSQSNLVCRLLLEIKHRSNTSGDRSRLPHNESSCPDSAAHIPCHRMHVSSRPPSRVEPWSIFMRRTSSVKPGDSA